MVKTLPKDMDLSALADQVKDNAAFSADQIKDMMKGMGIEGDLHMCNYYWDILYMRPAVGDAIINIAFLKNKRRSLYKCTFWHWYEKGIL